MIKKNAVLLALAVGALGCSPALANFDYTYKTTGTGTAGSAEFVLNGTSLQVIVTNLNGSITVPADLIHGVSFTPSAGSLTTTTHPTAVSYATTAGVNSWDCTGATCVNNTTLALPAATAWDLFHTSTYQVDDLAGSSKPGIGNVNVFGVTPPPGGIGNSNFNPIVNATTFTFTVSSDFDMSKAPSSVGLLFGTTGAITPGDTFTPEPGYYLVLSLGLSGLVLFRRRRGTA
uniref:PEP-CTERM protein-sorting domain-containing protein n=1 Tax=Solibacter usitatus (strain Ellin6076) TaxID=234267 RepID=Q01XI7_SOLUE